MAIPQQERTVTVRRCASYDAALVKEAVIRLGEDTAGSWATIIPRGAKVLLKPNLLIVEGIQFDNGYALLPDKPGLGCELDMDAIDKYRIQ
mgnify:CR=1 FL=1